MPSRFPGGPGDCGAAPPPVKGQSESADNPCLRVMVSYGLTCSLERPKEAELDGERGSYTESDLHGRLSAFEEAFEMRSAEFFTKWERNELPHTDDFFVWAGLCSHLGVRELDLA